MSLYQCPNCNHYYTKSVSQDEYDIDAADTNSKKASIIVCKCGHKHVCGYDKDIDGYYSWGDSYDHYKIGNLTTIDDLKEFKAIMLKGVDEDEFHTHITLDGSIYSNEKPRNKVVLSIDTDNYIRNNTNKIISHFDLFDGFGLGQIEISTIHKMVSLSIKHGIDFVFSKTASGFDDDSWTNRTIKADSDKLFVFPKRNSPGDLGSFWEDVEELEEVKAKIKTQKDV
jgi:transcription elongation factor Elf1